MVKSKYVQVCDAASALNSLNGLEVFNRFFARCDILCTDDDDIFAGITYINKQFCIIFGKKFFEIPLKNQAYVLAHELTHMMYKHPLVFADKCSDMLLQVSADLFINQMLNRILPKSCILDDSIQIEDFIAQGILKESDRDKDTLYYYNKLKIFQKNIKSDPRFNHESWKSFESLNELDKIAADSSIDKSLKAGNLPRVFRDVPITNFKSNINWKSILSRFLSNSFFTEEDRDFFHVNKRYPGFPGKYEKEIPHLLFAIDTSGSINNNDISEMFAQIDKVLKNGCKIDILEVDMVITKLPYLYNGNRPTKLSGGGGTDFEPALKHFNQNHKKYGAMVYLTDGYASVPSTKLLKPLLWVLTSSTGNTPETLKNQGFKGLTLKINHE